MRYDPPSGMRETQIRGYDDAYRVLRWAQRQRNLTDAHLCGKILDFGCGTGGSSIFLAQQSEDVTAIDLRSDMTRLLSIHRKHPRRVLTDDGLELMRRESGYLLITAFMLGTYDTARAFVEEFRDAAKHALTPDGIVIVTSDRGTLHTTCDVFGLPREAVQYTHIGNSETSKPGCLVLDPSTL